MRHDISTVVRHGHRVTLLRYYWCVEKLAEPPLGIRMLLCRAITFALLVLLVQTNAYAAKLPQIAVDRVQEKLIPAYRSGNKLVVRNILAAIVEKLGKEELSELDRMLEDNFLPTSGAILADIRLAANTPVSYTHLTLPTILLV